MSIKQNGTPERPNTKIMVLLRNDLESWQAVNVTAFLASGLPSGESDLIGDEYADADGVSYLPMFRQPVMILSASAEVLSAAHQRALARGTPLSVFTSDMFKTGNDEDNRAVVRAVPTDSLDLVGIGLHAGKNQADKIAKGAVMYR